MTGHGAHAFNQTYQPPRHHPVKYLSSASPPTTLAEKIWGKTWKKWFLERNSTLEEETVKVAGFPNFDKKLRLKTTSRSSLGMEGGDKKDFPGWPCHTWKGELEEKRTFGKEKVICLRKFSGEHILWIPKLSKVKIKKLKGQELPKFHGIHLEDIRIKWNEMKQYGR